MPAHHHVRASDVDLKRLGAVLAVAHDQGICNFASVLFVEGLGPRTLQSLAVVAEIIHGAPSRLSDSARFSFAHGAKDCHPFPVPLKTSTNRWRFWADRRLRRDCSIRRRWKGFGAWTVWRARWRASSSFWPISVLRYRYSSPMCRSLPPLACLQLAD